MRTNGLVSSVITLMSIAVRADDLQKRAFSVNAGRADYGRHIDGAAAVRKAYLKHGIDLPEHLHRKNKRQSSGTVSTVEAVSVANDLEYLSPINIGGHVLRLDLDTGSSDLWVFSDHLPAKQQQGHSLYTATQKQPNLQNGFSWKIAYGDGSGAAGLVYADKVHVGEATATRQAVEAATSISTEFIDEHSDGLLGLGFGTTNTIKPQKQQTFFENIRSSLKAPLFTVTLKKNSTGSYDFGYIDSKKYTGQIQYAPVNTSRGYWEYTLSGYQIGNDPNIVQTSYQSIADTGTTLLLLPASVTNAYYARVPGAKNVPTEGGWVFDCKTPLPDLTLKIGSAQGEHASCTVAGHFLNRGLSDTGSGFCYGGLQQGADKLSIWGDVFLKSQFVVFDGSPNPRIGFAAQSKSVDSRVVLTQNEAIPVDSSPNAANAPPPPSSPSFATIATTPANAGLAPIPTAPVQSSPSSSGATGGNANGVSLGGQEQNKPMATTATAQASANTPSLYLRFLTEFFRKYLFSGGSATARRKHVWDGVVPHGRRVRV